MEERQQSKPGKARLILDTGTRSIPINDRVFGSFVEHLGRGIYTGIYEPNHPTANKAGFRQDVIDLVKELGVTAIRYPGGNFVSGYRWEDGVGPRSERPKRIDLAWHSGESNEFGLHEMADWLDELGGNELMEAVNLGTRGIQEALDLLEYANIPSGTALSDMRRRNGREQPFGIRMWCLGNEMDGTWQVGHKTAHEYARLVTQTATAMRMIDPDLELVACGSSSHSMPTFGEWERTVLEEAYDQIDFISCHAYYEPHNRDMASFLASGVDMDGFIRDVASVIAAVRGRLKSKHQVYISFDEWNVWYQDAEPSKPPVGIGNWPQGSRLLEDIYSVADAVVFGDLLITLLRNVNIVHSASLAQLVNVIAPIMTEPGGPAWRQTIFFPFALTAKYAKGGSVLASQEDADSCETSQYGEVPMTDSVVVRGADGSLTIFVVNRSLDRSVEYRSDVSGLYKAGKVVIQSIHDKDVAARNTLEDPKRVGLQTRKDFTFENGKLSIMLPPVSWTAIHID